MDETLRYIGTAFFGGLSAIAGEAALEKMLEDANAKAIALSAKFNSVLDVQTYMKIQKAADAIVSGNDFPIFASAFIAGACAGMAIYYACSKSKE